MGRDGRLPTSGFKYERIADVIRRDMLDNLLPNDILPSERELADQFGVSRMTVRAAIATLVSQGRVYNIQGSGTYVGSKEVLTKSGALTSFTEDMVARGLRPSSRVICAQRVAATGMIAHRLAVEVGTACTHVRRLRLADEDPMALENVYFPAEVLPLEGVKLAESLYDQLAESGNEAFRSEQEISAIVLDDETAELLEVPEGAAALVVTRVSSTKRGRIIEYARTYYRADRYSFMTTVERESGER